MSRSHLPPIRALWALVAVSAATAHSFAAFAPANRPSVLFVLTDDQGPWTASAAGQKDVTTTHMDRVAREGARFTHAFTPTPVCSPARASLLTSRYGTELGILDSINPSVTKTGPGSRTSTPPSPNPVIPASTCRAPSA